MANKNVAFGVNMKDNTIQLSNMRTMIDKKINRLLEVFREKSLQRGTFTLASGLESNYYCDAKLTVLDSEGSHLLTEIILEQVKDLEVNCIGGLESGANSIIGSVITLAYEKGILGLKGFYVRREQKSHGTRKLIEGNVSPDDKVLILDDVITTGSSVANVIKVLKEMGCNNIIGVLCILDRNEGKRDPELDAYPVWSILEKSDLLG